MKSIGFRRMEWGWFRRARGRRRGRTHLQGQCGARRKPVDVDGRREWL